MQTIVGGAARKSHWRGLGVLARWQPVACARQIVGVAVAGMSVRRFLRGGIISRPLNRASGPKQTEGQSMFSTVPCSKLYADDFDPSKRIKICSLAHNAFARSKASIAGSTITSNS